MFDDFFGLNWRVNAPVRTGPAKLYSREELVAAYGEESADALLTLMKVPGGVFAFGQLFTAPDPEEAQIQLDKRIRPKAAE